MPSYVHAAFVLVAASIILATALPGRGMPPARAGAFCLALMATAGITFATAATVIVLAMVTPVPGYVVIAPAAAAVGLALTLWLTMFRLSAAPAAVARAEADESDGGDDGGGGGLPPVHEPPRDPGPSDGIQWDAFDRERATWESTRAPAREPVGA